MPDLNSYVFVVYNTSGEIWHLHEKNNVYLLTI